MVVPPNSPKLDRVEIETAMVTTGDPPISRTTQKK